MSPENFKTTIHTIWGWNAQTVLAERLGLQSARQVRKWIAGDAPIPKRAREEVRKGLREKKEELKRLGRI